MVSNKIIVVLLQSLSYDVAVSEMNYMNSLVKSNSAQFLKVSSKDTSLFNPIYENMVENKNLYVNAMLNHQVIRRPNKKNIFELAKQDGLKTGAAAYYWASEIYSDDTQKNKQEKEADVSIQYSNYYSRQSYPDHNVFTDSEFIRKKYNPNLLLIHLMGIEYAMNKFGLESEEYKKKIVELDSTLELIVPMWLEAGYNIIVTTEHGKTAKENEKPDGEEILPLWAMGKSFSKSDLGNRISKIGIAGTIYEVLSIKKPERFINCNVN